jgi:hypothetical protein
MKNALSRLVTVGAAWLVTACALQAQLPGAGAPSSGMNAAMTKLFGDVKGFTATAEMNNTGKTPMSMTMGMSYADKKVRMDIDLTQIKSAMMTADMSAMFKQMGMDKVSNLVLPDKKVMTTIYTGLQAYMDTPMGAEESAPDIKIESKEIGKETIDGHPCIKNLVTITDKKGEKTEATTWNAEDMQKFPIQIKTEGQGNTTIMKYKNVKMTVPDAKLFEAPAGFKKVASQQELMMIAQQKMMGGK